MDLPQLQDALDKLINKAFESVDEGELTKDDVIYALELALSDVKDGSYDTI